jgi:hypothetical protein
MSVPSTKATEKLRAAFVYTATREIYNLHVRDCPTGRGAT